MLASLACSITERPSPRIFLAKSYDIMFSTKLALQQRVPRICLTSWFVPLPSPLVCSLLKQTISLSFSLFVLFLMEHLHSLASTTQHNLAVKSRQIREIPENKKTLGPQELNADYILLQSAIGISVFLTSSPVHSWRPELSQMYILDLCSTTDISLSESTMLYRLPSIINSTSCINSAVKFSVSLASTPLHEWRPELSQVHVNLDLCRNKDLHSNSNLVIMVRVPDFCLARFHQASACILSDQPKKPIKPLENPEKNSRKVQQQLEIKTEHS